MSAMTPGPWSITAWSGDEAFVTAKHPETGKNMHVTMTAMRADAYAIAAVPTLLSVGEQSAITLKEAANVLEGKGLPAFAKLCRDQVERARAAIALARLGDGK